MDSNSHEFWNEISYLVSLLIATSLSIISFRRANIDERVKETIKKFHNVNYEQNKIFHRLATSTRSREIVISSIISEHIFRARKCSTEKIGKDESKTLQAITRISRKSIETPAMVSFLVFLPILLVYFFQNWLNKYDFIYIPMYGLCIFCLLWYVWLCKRILLVIGFIPLLLLLFLPLFGEEAVIKIQGLILVYLLFLFYNCFGLSGDLRKPELSSMNYIHESLKWCNKIGLISYLLFICLLHNVGINIQNIFCTRNEEIKELLFKLAPLEIFIYFVINIVIVYFLFVKKLERNLWRIFQYLVLEYFQPKLKKERYKKHLAYLVKKQKDYLNRLQIIAASDLDGLLLIKIQIDYEDKEY